MCKKSYQSLIQMGIIIIGCMLFYFNFNIVIVKGESMEPTYKNHEIVLAIKNTQKIKTNDVIVFNNLSDQKCIKRVLAYGKDRVSLKDGSIYVNNVKIQRYSCEGENVEYLLADDEYFVVGDNERNSEDSRIYGPIKRERVLGVIWEGAK